MPRKVWLLFMATALSKPSIVMVIVSLTMTCGHSVAHAQAFNDFDLPPHDYYERDHDDAMSRLLNRSAKGEYEFGTETGLPLLRKVLRDLGIPESSQILVFSQTSLQRRIISPQNPRAMYFNEDTHVAWMPGGKVEVISFDPQVGGMFYFEDPPELPGDQVSFALRRNCFGCHGGAATNFLPGPLARSNFTSETGRTVRQVPGHDRIGHGVPFEDRWGGYFVTRAPQSLEHLGNSFSARVDDKIVVDRVVNRSKADLAAFFDETKLLRPDSDILPLLLFDHQIEAHNLIMEGVYRDRSWQYEAKKWGEPTKKTRVDGEKFFDRLVSYLLFADEVSLHGHEIQRNPVFESAFSKNERKGPNGQSLKILNLNDRLFENRLSYMIYSRSFEEAPASMKERVYNRLWTILSPTSPPESYDYFESGERERILGILKATKTDLPEYWQEGVSVVAEGSSQ